MNKCHIVCDTSLLLYLGRIEKADLLPSLFKRIFVPDQVALELDAGRIMRQDTINPRQMNWARIVKVTNDEIDHLPLNKLGIGEKSVIAFAQKNAKECLAGIDDYVARSFAEQIGLKVIGLIGVLIQAKQNVLIPLIRPLLDSAQSEGFRITKKLYSDALQIANE